MGTSVPVVPLEEVDSLFTKKLSKVEANKMIAEVSFKEIKEAMFSIGDNKAPSPDGYSAKFFKKAWSIVGMMYVKQ